MTKTGPENSLKRLIVVDPGHFHATLLQKEMYAWLDRRVAVYAPLGRELLEYLSRVSAFNSRAANPTAWELEIHTSERAIDAMLGEAPGGIVVFTGRNRPKIDRILAALGAGLHVLADKPWIIDSQDMPKLDRALRLAREKNLAAYDIMTERYEVTSELQREFVRDPAVFGGPVEVRARSVHNIMKTVAGVPLRRPPWFFDVDEYGEGLADVGTHVVDLVQWTLFPDQMVDYARDIEFTGARRWPIRLTAEQVTQSTGESRREPLDYFCNNAVSYKLRGVPVSMEITWDWEAPPGAGDIYEAAFQGTKAAVEIRQGAAESHVPELYIKGGEIEAVEQRVAALQDRWPGVAAERKDGEIRIVIPLEFRVGHEAHFAQVTNRFVSYVNQPATIPAWEDAYMLAKYWVSTKGVDLGRVASV